MARSKYRAVRCEYDGHKFASKKERDRYIFLRHLEQGDEIVDLILQPRYPLLVNGQKLCTYIADFKYRNAAGKTIIEDVKGVLTPMYRLKKKLLRILHGIEITEI
jgi:hypothetical protein